MTKTTNTNPTYYIAIDVSEATLQIQDDQRTFAVDNDSEGHSKLRKHIKTHQNPLLDRRGAPRRATRPRKTASRTAKSSSFSLSSA